MIGRQQRWFRLTIGGVAAGGFALLVCAIAYRPWAPGPFDIVDFSEFLPLLQRTNGFRGAVAELSRYYAGHGRFIPLWYSYLALNWTLFGAWPAAWQCLHFGVVMLGTLAAFHVLCRLGLSQLSSFVFAMLFALSTAAVAAGTRLTGEPLGTTLFLVAVWLAVGFRDAIDWRARAVSIACAAIGMLFVKETFIACVPFVLFVAAMTSSDGRFVIQAPTRRILGLAALLVAITLVQVLGVWCVRLEQHPDAYASQYGSVGMSVPLMMARWGQVMLPAWSGPDYRLLLVPPNLVYLIGAALGGILAVQQGCTEQLRARVGAACLLSILGVLIYAPWPRFELFYGLPFALSAALVGASMLEELRSNRRLHVAAVAGWTISFSMLALSAFTVARAASARRELNRDVAQLIGESSADSIVVATGSLAIQEWQNTGATLRRYAAAITPGRPLPVVTDRSCDAAARLLSEPGGQQRMLVNYVDWCGTMGNPTVIVRRTFRYFDWRALVLATRQLEVDIIPLGSIHTAQQGRP